MPCSPSRIAPFCAALLCTAVLGVTNARAEPSAEANETAEPQAKVKKVTGETLALEAAKVQDEHCATTAARDTTRALKSIATVGEVWARLSEQYEKSGESFLLYWRGVLAQCMDQERRGLKDLKEFVAESGSSTLWTALVKDARRRIRQLERRIGVGTTKTMPSPPSAGGRTPGIVLGASLAGGSLATGIAAIDRWNRAVEAGDRLENKSEDPAVALVDQADFQLGAAEQDATQILSAVSAGLGAGAAIAFIVTAAAGGNSQAAIKPPTLVPTLGGAALHWELQW